MRSGIFLMEPLENRQMLSAAAVKVLLQDTFRGSEIIGENWHIPAWLDDPNSTYYGRTQIATSENEPPPEVSDGAVHLTLDTYNPTGFSFYGTELISNKTFKVKDGLIVRFRAKLNTPVSRGIVGGLFKYEVKPDGVNHDEVDFELLGNKAVKNGRKVLTNVYSNERFGSGSPIFSSVPLGDTLTEYHTYQATTYPNKVVWRIDGKKIRVEKGIVPAGPMKVHINLWAPDSNWPEAYNGRIQPTSDPSMNKRFTMDVSSVVVKSIVNRTTPPTPVTPGISITRVPAIGSTDNVYGRVSGVKLDDYSVAVFIKVGGGWWTKPYFSSPITGIELNGTWSCDVTTGGNDVSATEIRAYLVPNTFDVPLVGGNADLPDSLSSLKYATALR